MMIEGLELDQEKVICVTLKQVFILFGCYRMWLTNIIRTVDAMLLLPRLKVSRWSSQRSSVLVM